MVEALAVGDPAGNWKLAKHAQGGRRVLARDDDAAAVLAVAVGRRRWGIEQPKPRWRYRGAV